MSKHEIELVRTQEYATSTNSRAELDRLVQQKVVEILTARDEFMFEPFYRLRRIANEMKRLQTVPERRKWQVFYEQFGCLHCKTQERTHMGNGFCSDCYKWVLSSLKTIIRQTNPNAQAQAAPIRPGGMR